MSRQVLRGGAGWWVCFGLLFGVAAAGIEGQENAPLENDAKAWQADDPLNWDDFQGQPPVGSPFDAQTVWVWQTDARAIVQCTLGEALWRCAAAFDDPSAQALFLRSLSWVKSAGRSSAALLAHEQGHFDLAEAQARGLAAALAALHAEAQSADRLVAENDALRQLETVAEVAIQALTDAAQAEQARYERETAHGTDRAAQARWAAKIKVLLNNA